MFNTMTNATVRSIRVRRILCCLPVALVILFVWLLAPAANAEENEAYTVEAFILDETETVSEEVYTKEAMPAEYCRAADGYISCETEAITLPEDGAAAEAMAAFYDKTGVQPYVIVTDSIKVENLPEYEEDEAAYYMSDRYMKLFGMDEGHYLLVLLLNETGGFDVLQQVGDDADYYVMDYEAQDTMESLVRAAFDRDDADGSLAAIFTQAAEDVMHYTVYDEDWDPEEMYSIMSGYDYDDSSDSDIFLALFAFLFTPILIVVGLFIRKLKEETAAAKKAPQTTSAYENWAKNYLPELKEEKKTEGPKRANYPITCPGCGATAYPNDDGTCQYCGRAIYDPRR